MIDYIKPTERVNITNIGDWETAKFNKRSEILRQARDEMQVTQTEDQDLFYYNLATHLADKLATLHILNTDITGA